MKRQRAIDRLRTRLLRRRMPRLQMSFIVISSGLVAFVSSFALLELGFSSTAIRYPVALSLAYIAFLVQLRIWISAVRRRAPVDLASDAIDVLELVGHTDAGSPSGNSNAGNDSPEPDPEPDFELTGGDPVDLPGLDLDEGALYLIPIAVALAGLVASAYVVYIAPVLFAELILDGVIVTGVVRRFRRIEPRHWLAGAARRTWVPFAVLLVSASILGFLVESVEPGADSIGDLFRTSVSDSGIEAVRRR
jgi:hypothetical protein